MVGYGVKTHEAADLKCKNFELEICWPPLKRPRSDHYNCNGRMSLANFLLWRSAGFRFCNIEGSMSL